MTIFEKKSCCGAVLYATALVLASPVSAAADSAAPATELTLTGQARKAEKSTQAEKAPAPPLAVKGNARAVCKAGFDVRTDQYSPASTDFFENPPAATVKLKKPCQGAVVVRFASAVTVPGENDELFLQLHAKCRGDGGFANGCEKGDFHFGFPGGYGLRLVKGPAGGAPIHATQWIYPDMKPGFWKFMVMPAPSTGSTGVQLRERSLTVDAYKGG